MSDQPKPNAGASAAPDRHFMHIEADRKQHEERRAMVAAREAAAREAKKPESK